MTAARASVQEGTAALARSNWQAARKAFLSAVETGDEPEAHEGLGLALWFLGQVQAGIAERELAFERYVAERRCDDAARVAVWVSHQHAVAGRTSAARGWLARAERALEGLELSCPGQGWVAVEQARHAQTAEEQTTLARRAMTIARMSGDHDLEVFALSLLGRAEVSAGHREPGLLLLEEAMAAASSGRVRNVHTLAEAYCNLIEGCAATGDWKRGAEWCELVEDFALAHAATPLFGACRTVHADVLMATGQWPRAEDALHSALDAHARHGQRSAAPTVASLAELHVRQGRLLEAERLLSGREEEATSLRALAALRMAEGRPTEAVALLERGLHSVTDHAVRAAHLLAPLVDARLDCGDLTGAEAATAQLSEIAAVTGIHLVEALASLAAARVMLASGLTDDAAEPARRALAAFSRLAMPYGCAQARIELARATAGSSPEQARDDVRTALATFGQLGAARAADVAAGMLRSLGYGSRPGRRTTGQLTSREQEVLELVALGMSNARIAATLVISEKTAGHHVSRILSKLGVRNRTEAAAHAATAAREA